jgi:hypothetical protein
LWVLLRGGEGKGVVPAAWVQALQGEGVKPARIFIP